MTRYHFRCHCWATRGCLRKHPDHFDRLPRRITCGKRTFRDDDFADRNYDGLAA
ncbi:hypothetical protein M0D68_14410 [Paraburkholderia sp. SEWSISQ10-3 4]|uniref:hypothetical protein n=1 Tax=Paraburkholderia TaxID=1822464 RepID=UPI00224E1EBA|nr:MULTISPECIES: hypothetical protein [Paraburkholderia]MCX4139384.1 hypothetical protein [Paraburkholderia aspalathi]MDN7172072.1 hypothetical protein [Paraburkholderia sp. SEWSISQ10-3 4]MDQ6501711.1 hypothetical protein [Paraburkholderia aspalathi]